MIKAIIIEDEAPSRQLLQQMLAENFTDIVLLACCKNVEEGKAAIELHHPDLVFTDIELEKQSVFEMLEQLEKIDFAVVFTTAYQEYAIQAIKFSALDYLLKPFSVAKLAKSITRYKENLHKRRTDEQWMALFNNLKKNSKKIVLHTSKGIKLIGIKEILRCKGDENATFFYLVDKTEIWVSETLKTFEDMLNDYGFMRVHKSHLVNLQHVVNYGRGGEGGILTLSNGLEVDVARRKKDEFIKRLENL